MEKLIETENITLRYRGSSKLNKVKKIDIFPKIEEPYKTSSSVGGTFSIVAFLIIGWLIYSEICYYYDNRVIFKFSPDVNLEEKLEVDIDITVAMICGDIGADILDPTREQSLKFGTLDVEDAWFELSDNQRIVFDERRHMNSYLREEYHAIKDLLWSSSYSSLSFHELPPRENKPDRPYDACRIHGKLVLNKLAGNLHITVGKTLPIAMGHYHIPTIDAIYNFSHRINKFSFGHPSPGIIHPLEGDEIIVDEPMTVINYFIEVVPTTVKTFLNTISTYQYSVKELKRPIDHSKGSHGMAGIFFKYDMSALRVTVNQERDNLGMFLAKLCAIVGGVYVCLGILNNVVQKIVPFVFSNFGKENLIQS